MVRFSQQVVLRRRTTRLGMRTRLSGLPEDWCGPLRGGRRVHLRW